MGTNRVWIETVALGTAIACALALLIATLAAATIAVTGSPESAQTPEPAFIPSRTFEGMVTCSRCGAKHSAALGKTASDCTRQCVHGGAAFDLVDGDRTYTLEGDLTVFKKVAGQRARVVGSIRGNTIKVASIVADN
jgi:hypothetical protein